MAIQVDKDVLNYYVQNAQVPLDMIRSRIEKLDLFLSGEKQPTFKQLTDIAKKINIPTGLLLLNKKVNIENKHLEFRTVESRPLQLLSPELRDTINEMQLKQDFLRQEVEIDLGFIGKFSINDNPLIVASAIRELLDLPEFFQPLANDKPIQYLRQKFNNIGVFIFFNGKVKSNTHRILNVNEFRGFVLSDLKAPIIFINQADSKAGQLFTLVHELVHLFINSNEIFNTVETDDYSFSKEEAFTNKVTAEILVPKREFMKSDLQNSRQLAKKFMVSEFVIVRRLFDLQNITEAEYKKRTKELKEQFVNITKKKTNGGNYTQNLRFMIDRKFLSYIEQALNKDRISYTDAFQLIGVGMKGYKKLFPTR